MAFALAKVRASNAYIITILASGAGFVAEARAPGPYAEFPDNPLDRIDWAADAPPRDDRPVDAFRYYKLAAAADVPGPAKAVLWVLAHHANHRSGRAFAYIETIAREAGVSARSVKYALRRLEQFGIVRTVKGTKRHSREQGANVYTFTDRGA